MCAPFFEFHYLKTTLTISKLLSREVVSAIDLSCLERNAIKLPREKYRMTSFTSDEVLAAPVFDVTCHSDTWGNRENDKNDSRFLASVFSVGSLTSSLSLTPNQRSPIMLGVFQNHLYFLYSLVSALLERNF